jgi:hypothetical protein
MKLLRQARLQFLFNKVLQNFDKCLGVHTLQQTAYLFAKFGHAILALSEAMSAAQHNKYCDRSNEVNSGFARCHPQLKKQIANLHQQFRSRLPSPTRARACLQPGTFKNHPTHRILEEGNPNIIDDAQASLTNADNYDAARFQS